MKRIYSISTALTFVCATSALAVDKAAVLDTYANIAAAKYQDSLVTAQTLQAAVNTLGSGLITRIGQWPRERLQT